MPDADHAATVLVLRDEGDPFEVLMVERNDRGFFSSIEVFPGGRVEEFDVADGGRTGDERAHRRAALRELAEEAGLALTNRGAVPYRGGKDELFYGWLSQEGLQPAAESLILMSRWVTPEGAPRRFDTNFYLAAPGPLPPVVIDAEELVAHRWTTPSEALSRHESGEAAMIMPTVAHLRWLSKRSSIDDAMGSAEGADGRTLIEPSRDQDGTWLPRHRLGEAK